MSKIITVLVAVAPILAGLLWMAGWLIRDAIRERRQQRTAARMAKRYRPHRQVRAEKPDTESS